MNGESPQISFIPKKTLGEDDVFIARPRPRSILGILAIVLFLGSIGAYIGFYFYEDLLSRNIQKKTTEIDTAERALSSSPEISKAKAFNARADLARTLLNQHIIVSPLFDFLAQNTLGSIFYSDLSFKDEKGVLAVSLKGESPSYASLAYQSDIFRAQKDVVGFSTKNIALTKNGSVSFEFTMALDRSLLLYEKTTTAQASTSVGSTLPAVTLPATTTVTIPPKPAAPPSPQENKGTIPLNLNFL